MRKPRAISWAGTQKVLAAKLGISAQAVNKWPDIIPLKQAVRLVTLSGGRLALRARDYA